MYNPTPSFDHPVFHQFSQTPTIVHEDYIENFLGAKFRVSWDSQISRPEDGVSYSSGASQTTPLLPIRNSEDYYEWISLLTSICNAHSQFVMLDLGAGYGRWGINAICAIRRLRNNSGLKPFVLCIEPDPDRYGWMREAFELNDISTDNFQILNVGIADNSGAAAMSSDPYGYGNLVSTLPDNLIAMVEGNHVRKLYDQNGSVYNVVNTVSPVALLLPTIDNFAIIDLIDMDIQGAEMGFISEAIRLCNSHVKTLHISTHDSDEELALYELLIRNQWRILRFHRRRARTHGEFGSFLSDDGVLHASNIRF